MPLASRELEILRAIQREGGVAGVTTISVACDLTSGYVDSLCRYLSRGGYLARAIWAGTYELTPKGEAALGRGAFELGRYLEVEGQSQMAQALYRTLHTLASLLESETGQPLTIRRPTRRIAGARQVEAHPEEEITIKTGFIDPLEGVEVELEASFDRIGSLEETTSDIAQAVAALQDLKVGTEDSEREE